MHFIPAVDEAPQLAWEHNVDGTANLLRVMDTAPARAFLFTSTAAVYPDVSTPVSELVEPAPIDVYGETKLACERMIVEAARHWPARVAIARVFNAIGPRETNPHLVPEIVAQLRSGASELELGNADTQRDFTDVRDVARALAALLVEPREGLQVFNVGSGRATAVKDLVGACSRILGRPVTIRRCPSRVRAIDRSVLVADISSISKTYGWEPSRTLEMSLSELLNGCEGAIYDRVSTLSAGAGRSKPTLRTIAR
jgi:UDP-glucose 4-epimerase